MQLAIDLSLPADTRLLAATRKVLTVYLRELGTPPTIVDDVILAVDEACSNVIKHAYPDGERDGDNYLLRASLQSEKILIEVEDKGIGFDIMAKPGNSGEDGAAAVSGRGLDVMRRLMTTVEVESPTRSGGTRLRLVRLLPSRGD